MVTKKEGVITVYDGQGDLFAVVLKDEKTRKNIIFTVNEMGFEDIQSFFDTMSEMENTVEDHLKQWSHRDADGELADKKREDEKEAML